MSPRVTPPPCRRPSTWALVLAFTLVYLAWGTTYLAIKEGVKEFPPALFGGVRVALAGLVLLGYLALRGERVRLPRRELAWTGLVGVFLFVGGNGLITAAEQTVASGVASVLVATTPLWMALLGAAGPRGERLAARGWVGLLTGLAGVLVVLSPKLGDGDGRAGDAGPLLVLGSAFCWSVGSLLVRYQRARTSHLAGAAYQMLIGGGTMTLVGLALGEPARLTPERFTFPAVYAFFHLLVFGSLVGFVAYNWLLGNVSPALAGTYAYVNPVVAVLVGWLLAGETPTEGVVGGMLVILAGVALVRGARGGAAGKPLSFPRRSVTMTEEARPGQTEEPLWPALDPPGSRAPSR